MHAGASRVIASLWQAEDVATAQLMAWKFFGRVEAVLTDNTKLEIAVWWLDRELDNPYRQSIVRMIRVFERTFRKKYLTWSSFLGSLATSLIRLLSVIIISLLNPSVAKKPFAGRFAATHTTTHPLMVAFYF
jgi:CHAT domain-containing protein